MNPPTVCGTAEFAGSRDQYPPAWPERRKIPVTRTDNGKLTPYQWETDEQDFNPALHYANFLVAGGPTPLSRAKASAELTFGPPQRVYQFDGYIVMVWNTNLLTELVRFRTHP